MRQRIALKSFDKVYLKLYTIRDTTEIAKQYAFLNHATKKVDRITRAIVGGTEDTNYDVLVNDLEFELEEISLRAEFAIDKINELEKKVSRFLKQL